MEEGQELEEEKEGFITETLFTNRFCLARINSEVTLYVYKVSLSERLETSNESVQMRKTKQAVRKLQ